MWIPAPGSDTDLRRSAKIARAGMVMATGYAGLVFLAIPHVVRTGNVVLVRELMPLQVWGAVWLACAVAMCTRRREAGYAMLSFSFLLYAVATGATAITGTMDAPIAPMLFVALAGVSWWLRARAMQRSAGRLRSDDITVGR